MFPIPLQLPDADITFYPAFLEQQESDRLLTALTQTIDWRQDWITIYGRSLPQPRLTAWYDDAGKSYTYSGITMVPMAWTPLLLELKASVETVCDAGFNGFNGFNSVLLNLYRDGNDSMGWHSDDEAELGHNPVLGSLSLGGMRRFTLRHRSEKGSMLNSWPGLVRRQLVKIMTGERNRLARLRGVAQADVEAHIEWLKAHIKQIDAATEQQIRLPCSRCCQS